MFRLTREVRLAINPQPDKQLAHKPTNSYGAFPSLSALSRYFAIRVTLQGALQPHSSYLRNIKEIDDVVRQRGIPVIVQRLEQSPHQANFDLPLKLFETLHPAWPGDLLQQVCLMLSPQTSIASLASEPNMIRLSQKFEFCASHRLHNPSLSDEENRKVYGKCNNPHGHGHNYELQVTIAGIPDGKGVLIDVPKFEQVVGETVIEPLDHKNLNTEVKEFAAVIPSCENIARVIHGLLKPKLEALRVKLASVTVWETAKTWCEYSE